MLSADSIYRAEHAFSIGSHIPCRKASGCPSVHFFLARLSARKTKVLRKEKADFLRSRLFKFRMVPEARVELARLSTTVFETAASAIPPLGREIELYPMFPKAQTEISEHAQKATMQARKTVRTGTEIPKRVSFDAKTPTHDASRSDSQ